MLIVAPNGAAVSVTPVPGVATAVTTAPLPVGAVSTIVGVDVHACVSVDTVTLAGTPALDAIVPVIEQPVPPPVDVNAVLVAYPVPLPLSATTYGATAIVGTAVHPWLLAYVSVTLAGTPPVALSVPVTTQFAPPPVLSNGVAP